MARSGSKTTSASAIHAPTSTLNGFCPLSTCQHRKRSHWMGMLASLEGTRCNAPPRRSPMTPQYFVKPIPPKRTLLEGSLHAANPWIAHEGREKVCGNSGGGGAAARNAMLRAAGPRADRRGGLHSRGPERTTRLHRGGRVAHTPPKHRHV